MIMLYIVLVIMLVSLMLDIIAKVDSAPTAEGASIVIRSITLFVFFFYILSII
jgi:hypothetical protein